MSTTISGSKKSSPRPETLESWRQCEEDLRQRRRANLVEREEIALERRQLALSAARGDAAAQKRIEQLVARDTNLQLAFGNLEYGLSMAAQEIAAKESVEAQDARRTALARLDEKLAARLTLIAEIENRLGDAASFLDQLCELTNEIERTHDLLGGERQILPALAKEAVGGRLAEFMAGSAFAAWLPLARPEIRPALTSWVAAERDIQKSYQLSA